MPSAKWNSHNGRLRSSGGAGDFPDHLVELSATAGGGHLNSPQMVVEVDVGVLQPHRVMQSPWNVDELVAQRIQQMQPAEQRAAKHVEGEVAVAICIIDDRDLQGVRVQVGRLAVQQHRIHAVQPLHVRLTRSKTFDHYRQRTAPVGAVTCAIAFGDRVVFASRYSCGQCGFCTALDHPRLPHEVPSSSMSNVERYWSKTGSRSPMATPDPSSE